MWQFTSNFLIPLLSAPLLFSEPSASKTENATPRTRSDRHDLPRPAPDFFATPQTTLTPIHAAAYGQNSRIIRQRPVYFVPVANNSSPSAARRFLQPVAAHTLAAAQLSSNAPINSPRSTNLRRTIPHRLNYLPIKLPTSPWFAFFGNLFPGKTENLKPQLPSQQMVSHSLPQRLCRISCHEPLQTGKQAPCRLLAAPSLPS
jgi:hypothetical protein